MFVVLQVVVGLGVVGFACWEANNWTRELLLFYMICYAVSASVLPWNLMLLRSPAAESPCVGELLLTRLTPRELAFGLYFWPGVVSFVLPGVLFAVIGTVVLLDVWDWGEVVIVMLLMMACMGAAMLATNLVTIKLWVMLGRTRLGLLLAAPLLLVALFLLFVGPSALAERVDVELYGWRPTIAPALAASTALVWLIMLRQCALVGLRFVPSRAIHPVLPEAIEEASAFGNAAAVWRNLEARRRVREAIHAVGRMTNKPALVGCALATGVFGIVTVVLAQALGAIRLSTQTGARTNAADALGGVYLVHFGTVLGPVLWLTFAVPLAVMCIRHRCGGFPVLGGGAWRGMLRALLWPIVGYGGALLAARLSLLASPIYEATFGIVGDILLLVLTFAAGVATSLAMAVMMLLPGRYRWLRVEVVALLPVALLLARYVRLPPPQPIWRLEFYGDVAPALMVPFLILAAGLLILHLPELAQAVHTRILRGAAPGEVRMAWPQEKRE